MKIGLFFGSFNPIHYGHLIVANYVCHAKKLDKIWLVISPHNPHKKTVDIEEAESRAKMAEMAVLGNDKLYISRIELVLSSPSYTINTLNYLKKTRPEHKYSIIAGADVVKAISTWKDFKEITNNYKIYGVDRVNTNSNPYMNNPHQWNDFYKNIEYIEKTPRIDISSTMIREYIKKNVPIDYLTPISVIEYIKKNNLYNSNNC